MVKCRLTHNSSVKISLQLVVRFKIWGGRARSVLIPVDTKALNLLGIAALNFTN